MIIGINWLVVTTTFLSTISSLEPSERVTLSTLSRVGIAPAEFVCCLTEMNWRASPAEPQNKAETSMMSLSESKSVMVSRPTSTAPKTKVSAPPPPASRSSPPPPEMISSPGPPPRMSAPKPPRMIRRFVPCPAVRFTVLISVLKFQITAPRHFDWR